jgi:hypothetical protein
VNREERSGLEIRRLIYVVSCDTASTCEPVTPDARVTVWSSRVGLTDLLAPTFSVAPSGSLLQSPAEGDRLVTFHAEDHGSGIASVALSVDGHLLEDQPADPAWPTCSPPYHVTVPCPRAIDRTLILDTTRFPNGPHQVRVVIVDAAGNRTLSDPVTVEFHNPGLPNGAGASRFAKLDAWFDTRGAKHRTTAVLAYGHTRAVAGRLTDERGAPIAGAKLDLTNTAARSGARARPIGQIATDSKGRFRYLPRAGTSREILVSYRAFALDDSPSASAAVTVQVRAGVTLKVAPRRVSAHGTIRFSGRLRGGQGRTGTQVVIYALGGPRERIPVTTVRANAKGRFHYRYRFRNSSPGTTYRFLATMHLQRSYPYATGSSRTVKVTIR